MRYEKGSFTTVPNIVALKGLHATAQCLFMWLCHHANQDGQCFPSRKRLAELCDVSVDMIDKMMKILTEKGIVEKKTRRVGTKNETNIYCIIIGGVADGIGYLADGIGQGVADGIGSELNPLSLTKSNELVIKEKREKFISEVKECFKDTKVDTNLIPRLQEFVGYWTEPDKNWKEQRNPKIRYDHEKTWDMKRRIGTWMRNQVKFGGASAPKHNKYKATMVGINK